MTQVSVPGASSWDKACFCWGGGWRGQVTAVYARSEWCSGKGPVQTGPNLLTLEGFLPVSFLWNRDPNFFFQGQAFPTILLTVETELNIHIQRLICVSLSSTGTNWPTSSAFTLGQWLPASSAAVPSCAGNDQTRTPKARLWRLVLPLPVSRSGPFWRRTRVFFVAFSDCVGRSSYMLRPDPYAHRDNPT